MILSEELYSVLPNPVHIVSLLNNYVIGQEKAKKTLATLLLNRALKKLQKNGLIDGKIDLPKANVLLIGPTGVGKTSLIRALSKISGIPISITDVTSFTDAGYMGGKVEDILINHVNTTFDYVNSIELPQLPTNEQENFCYKDELFYEYLLTGIVYIDEIDKLCVRQNDQRSNSVGRLVQGELLKILENGDVTIDQSHYKEHRNKNQAKISSVKTDDIFFICGGAFAGLTDVVYDRLKKNNSIGFNSNLSLLENKNNSDFLLNQVVTQDLIDYGFKPELLGRLPIITNLNNLTRANYREILLNTENNLITQYTTMFKLFNVDLIFEDEAVDEIITKAEKLEMGARTLKGIFNHLFVDEVYNIFTLQETRLRITREFVRSRCG